MSLSDYVAATDYLKQYLKEIESKIWEAIFVGSLWTFIDT